MRIFKRRLLIQFIALSTFFWLASCQHKPDVFFNNTPKISTQCDPDTVYFQNDILPLLNSTCAVTGCHDAQTGKHGVVLVDYNSVMKTGEISIGNPSDSKIYAVVTKKDNERMPPSPYQSWTSSDVSMLYTWIKQGALNNECNADGSVCDTSNVNFNKDVAPIFQTYCFGCHSQANPSGGVDLTNFDQLATLIDNGSLLGSINGAAGYNPMPKGGSKLSNCDILKITIWANDTTLSPPPGGGGGSGTGHPCAPDSTYFQNDVLPLLMSNCATTGCHNQSSHQHGVILTDYSSIIQTGKVVAGNPSSSKLYNVLFGGGGDGGDGGDGGRDDDIMPPPPAAPFNTSQKNIIKNWILQGALNNYCDGNCDTTHVTYSQGVAPIIQNYCLGCHNTNPGGGISLRNYSEVVVQANNGKLWGSINHDPGFSPMPKNGNKLTVCDLATIKIWIENGTPNN